MTVAFVLCVERGELEAKALLFCRSLRRFGGRMGGAPIYTFQPRHDTTVSLETLQALESLGVRHSDATLNRDFEHYPIANKIFAAAHAEQTSGEDVLVFVDSDTIITSEPAGLALPDGVDAAARPVDIHRHESEPDDDDDPFWLTHHRRVSSTGRGDAMDDYWMRMYELTGVFSEPLLTTTCSRQRIRAYFNSGLVAVRRSAGLFGQWKSDFLTLTDAGHIPRRGDLHYMDQLSLACTLTRAWTRLSLLDGRYNYPLPGRAALEEPMRTAPLEDLVHVHYNRLFAKRDWLARIDPPLPAGPVRDWLETQLPLGRAAQAEEPGLAEAM